MSTAHAVGIDLGTTYSCIAYLNEQGEPISIPNQEGEISTPSVVMHDKGEQVIGTEALRNAIMNPAQTYLAAHWLSDAVAGVLLGTTFALGTAVVVHVVRERGQPPPDRANPLLQ